MKPVSDLTYKIIAFPQIPIVDPDECIGWAIEMVGLGYEQPELLMLAAFTKPSNYFEIMEYLHAALKALELTPKAGEEGQLSYASYFVRKISKGIDVKTNLESIVRYSDFDCCEGEGKLDDFHLLWFAWGDLDYGNERQDYWPEADINNIESIVVDKAQQWVTENRTILERLIA